MYGRAADAKARLGRRSGAALAVLFSAIVMVISPVFAFGWTLSFGNSGSADLLEALTEKARIDTSLAEPVSVIGPDGSMPEIAVRHIPMRSGAENAIVAIKRACATLGLSPPDADMRASEPEAICGGKYRTATVSVVATVTGQDSDIPTLSLEIRAIDY